MVKFPLAVVITGQDVSLSSTLGKTDMRLRATGQVARQLGTALTLGVTAPLLGIGVAAVRTGTQVETNLLGIRAAANLTAEEMDKLHASARTFSDLGVGARDATDGMLAYAKAGLSVTSINAAMRPTILLAKSAQMEFGQVAEGVVNIMSGYRKEFSETTLVADQLTFATDATTNDLTDLLEAFKEGGPVARGLNQRFSETTALLALLGQNGLKGSKGGTALAGSLARLANMTPEVTKRLAALKIDPSEIQTSTGGLRSMVDVIELLEQRGAQADDVLEIFGRNAGPGMLALLGAGSRGIRKLAADLDGAGGSSLKKYTLVAGGAAGAQERLTASLQNLADSVASSGVLDTFTRLVRRVDDVTKGLDKLSPATKEVLVIAGAAAIVVGPFLALFGNAVRIYETVKALRLIAAAQTLIGNTAAAATPKVAGLGAASKATAASGFARFLTPLLAAGGAALLLSGDNESERSNRELESLQNARLRALATEAGENPYAGMTVNSPANVERRIGELLGRGFGRSREFQRIEVIFKNTPQGTRVNTDNASGISSDVGYAMSNP